MALVVAAGGRGGRMSSSLIEFESYEKKKTLFLYLNN